jgi:organizing structure protein 2
MAPRNFYEDEKSVIPLPGTSITATPAEIEALGPNQIINGSSVRSPSLIQSKIEHLRQKVNSFYTFSNEKIDEATQAYNTKEQHFTSTISNLHNKDEDLLANGQYVLVAGLSGLILTRRSNVLFKAVAPVALALLAFKFALPKTWSNTIGFAHDVEKEKFPALVVKQDCLVKTANDLISSTESKTSNAEKEVESKLSEAKGAFKKFTGLRIDEDATKK